MKRTSEVVLLKALINNGKGIVDNDFNRLSGKIYDIMLENDMRFININNIINILESTQFVLFIDNSEQDEMYIYNKDNDMLLTLEYWYDSLEWFINHSIIYIDRSILHKDNMEGYKIKKGILIEA